MLAAIYFKTALYIGGKLSFSTTVKGRKIVPQMEAVNGITL